MPARVADAGAHLLAESQEPGKVGELPHRGSARPGRDTAAQLARRFQASRARHRLKRCCAMQGPCRTWS